MGKNDLIRKIAEKEYELFVVNTHAAGIQQLDGKYITKYVPISPFIIENMILENGSMGCYQQGYKTDKIKWICLDFDCKNKQNPNLIELYNQYVKPFTNTLDDLKIEYLTEFSGRRGIHVWIVFSELFSKRIGYKILKRLINKTEELSDISYSEQWGLDIFPATDSSKNNVVGKQVKFPLSTHKSGSKSYFFINDFNYKYDTLSASFYKEQLEIMENYKSNQLQGVLNNLDLSDEEIEYQTIKYKKFIITEDIEATVDEVINILSETKVYKAIFDRMKVGISKVQDRTVLLGTLVHCDKNAKLITEIFRRYPNFDEEKTVKNIEKFKNKYYPATFEYLYEIYNMSIESELDKSETGLQYLYRKLGMGEHLLQQFSSINENKSLIDISVTVEKEKNYLKENDEVPNILILNDLRNLKPYDLKFYMEVIENIKNGKEECFVPKDFYTYDRYESNGKTRKLVSLSAYNRVITTHLALELCKKINYKWKSYSYNVSFISSSNIFYYWYSSWGKFINKLRVFFDIPFMDKYSVFYLDIKNFYNNVDFLTVYRTFEQSLNDSARNIFLKLVEYNDILMKSIFSKKRVGVPQGPAYARIISEMYLDRVLENILKKYDNSMFYMYRYVDDIVFFCNPEFDGRALYDKLLSQLFTYGLPLNQEKSRYFGEISSLSEEEKNFILHTDRFNYDLQENDFTGVLFERERIKKLKKYRNEHTFDFDSLGYIFGQKTIKEAQMWYIKDYKEDILRSREGRGSNFRKFYSYLLKNENIMEDILNCEDLFLIPLDTINFSNFVHVLYLFVQNKEISSGLFNRIREEYLMKLGEEDISAADCVVINALKIIVMEV